MTRREELYGDGFHEGRRWAEEDIASSVNRYEDMRGNNVAELASGSDDNRAWILGCLRGYSDTYARYDAGTYTRAMFEHEPLGR